MRREGRMHGSYVRESKHSPWPPVKAPSKPTNHSKCTSNCLSNRVRCKGCAYGLPMSKSKDKTKGGLKAKAFNITSNYKMQEWRVCDSSPGSSMKKPVLKVERPLAAWDQYAQLDHHSDSDCEDYLEPDNDIEEEYPNSWNSGIVLPIESLVRMRKMPEAPVDLVSDETDDSVFESDDSWSGVGLSDGDDVSDGEESWADDWSLVEEAL